MTDADALLQGAREYVEAARASLAAGRLRVAFEEARHAAELATKGILQHGIGSYPQQHQVAHLLSREGLVPSGVSVERLHQLLGEFTLGTYGFNRRVSRRNAEGALRIAERMVAGAERALDKNRKE